MMPMVIDSPSTWPMIRLLRQPSALRVPNSRTRRDTADMVSRLASRKAATRTAIASHLPRLLARLEALDSEPVTSLARSLEVVTVALGVACVISLDTVEISGRAGRRHVDRVHLVLHAGQRLRAAERDVDVGRIWPAAARDPDHLERGPGDADFEPRLSLFCLA